MLNGAIFPAAPLKIDLAALNGAGNDPSNSYGTRLASALASTPPVAAALAKAAQFDTVRTQLMLEQSGVHHAIRWERLEFAGWPGAPLSTSDSTPFSRFAATNRDLELPLEDGVFRLLLVIASPDDPTLDRIDAAAQCRAAYESLKPMLVAGQMKMTVLCGGSGPGDDLAAELSRSGVRLVPERPAAARVAFELGSADALHVIAHGTRPRGEYFLHLEDSGGGSAPLPADGFISMLHPAPVRLVFLESCQSAAAGAETGGFLYQLMQAGIPAAVGMQDLIRVVDAARFRSGFYQSLLEQGSVDVAANNGRRLLESPEIPALAWSIPAVGTRLIAGRLWAESPLRAASRKLHDALAEATSKPPFPVDIVELPVPENPAPDQTFDDAAPSDPGRVDAEKALPAELTAKPGILCLIGPPGRHKREILRSLFIRETERHWRGEQPLIPVLFRLADCAHSSFEPAESVSEAVARYFESKAGAELQPAYLRGCLGKQRFLFLIEGDEGPGGTTLRSTLELLDSFRAANPGHAYAASLDQNSLLIRDLPGGSRCFSILPMRFERIQAYLREFPDGPAFGEQIQSSRVFDLVEVPYLFAEMLDQFRRRVLGKTRAEILNRMIEERLARFRVAATVRARARDVLYRFAWELQIRRDRALCGPELFDLLRDARGNLDYSLVDLCDGLIDCGILAPGGEEGVRFAFGAFQSYCAAAYLCDQPPDRRIRLLEDVTATLGRRARARLWNEVLIVLAGLWDDTVTLLRLILSGSPLHEGEQLLIAARCLQEARTAFATHHSADPVVRSIIKGLIHASHPLSLRSVPSRKRVLEFLGPLIPSCASSNDEDQAPVDNERLAAIRHLASLVMGRIRPSDDGRMIYDFSGVRLAAVRALLYAPKQVLRYVSETPQLCSDQELNDVLRFWLGFDRPRLADTVSGASGEIAVTIGCFALAILGATEAFSTLVGRFDSSDSSDDLIWAVTDSLIQLGAPLFDFLDQRLGNPARWSYLIYMIGLTGGAGRPEHFLPFVRERLHDPEPMIAGRALSALARLGQDVLETCNRWASSDSFYLSYYALQTLRTAGDASSLEVLEQPRWLAGARPDNAIFLEKLRLEVYEEIYWRLAGGIAREVMTTITGTSDPDRRS